MQKSTPEPRAEVPLSLATGSTEQMCRGTGAKHWSKGRAVEQGRRGVSAAIVSSGCAGGPAWKRGMSGNLMGHV